MRIVSRRAMGVAVALTAAVTFPATAGAGAPGVAYTSTDVRDTWSANGTVRSLSTTSERIYLGGDFTRMRDGDGTSRRRTRLSALTDGGSRLSTAWKPTVDGRVRDVMARGRGGLPDIVYVGGSFSTVNGTPRDNVVAIGHDGAVIDGFRANTDGEVWSITRLGGDVLLGGDFSTVRGQPCPALCRVDGETGQPTSWSADVGGGGVRTVDVTADRERLVVGGTFRTLSDRPRDFLGEVDLDTGAVTSFTPPRMCSDCGVLDVTSTQDTVYAAVAGGGGGRAAAYDLETSQRRWSIKADGDVQAVALRDGVLYAGGHFGPTFDGQERHQLAAVNPVDGALQSWRVTMEGQDAPGVWDLQAASEGLYVAGGFRSLGPSGQSRFAVLEPTSG